MSEDKSIMTYKQCHYKKCQRVIIDRVKISKLVTKMSQNVTQTQSLWLRSFESGSTLKWTAQGKWTVRGGSSTRSHGMKMDGPEKWKVEWKWTVIYPTGHSFEVELGGHDVTHMIWPISYWSYDIGNVRDAIKSCKNLSRFSRRLFLDNIPVKMIVNVQIQDFLFTDKNKKTV